jgi:hypothetical protein
MKLVMNVCTRFAKWRLRNHRSVTKRSGGCFTLRPVAWPPHSNGFTVAELGRSRSAGPCCAGHSTQLALITWCAVRLLIRRNFTSDIRRGLPALNYSKCDIF